MSHQSLIPTFAGQINGHDVLLSNAREVHEFLQVGRDFSNWIKSRIEQFGFIEGEDYVVFDPPVLANQTGRGGDRRSLDYHITLDMAKELAMVERSERGRQARRYFIECERRMLELRDMLGLHLRPVTSAATISDSQRYAISKAIDQAVEPCRDRLAAKRSIRAHLARVTGGTISEIKPSQYHMASELINMFAVRIRAFESMAKLAEMQIFDTFAPEQGYSLPRMQLTLN